jgi:hypothetical protein
VVGVRFLSSPRRPDRLWGTSRLQLNGGGGGGGGAPGINGPGVERDGNHQNNEFF